MDETVKQRLLHYISKLSDQQQRSLLVKFEDAFKLESRKFARKQYVMQVDYATKDQFHNDFIDNISLSGMFIKTSAKFHVGDEVTLSLSVPKNNEHLKIKGEVVRVSEDGIGVEYKISPYLKEDIVRKLKID